MVNGVPGEVNRALVHIEHLPPESVFAYGEAFAADCDFVMPNGERLHMSAVVFLADDTFGCLIAYDPIPRGSSPPHPTKRRTRSAWVPTMSSSPATPMR